MAAENNDDTAHVSRRRRVDSHHSHDHKIDHQKEIEDRFKEDEEHQELIYHVDDNVPPHLCLLFGIQQLFVCLGGIFAAPMAVSSIICAEYDSALKVELFATMLVVVGVASILITLAGTRLPIIQGASFSFIPPIVGLMALSQWKCPSTPEEWAEEKEATGLDPPVRRIREISGALMAASCVQLFISSAGLVGFLMKYIGPLTITPAVALIGINLYGVINGMCEKHWGLALFTIVMTLLCSLYIGNKLILPIPSWSKASGWQMFHLPIFTVFPALIALAVAWILAVILTATGVLPDDPKNPAYWARSDANVKIVSETPWFVLPYPGQFGMPTISIASFVGMLIAIFSGIIEAVGDYYACAKICQLPPPPAHAVNRALLCEGLGCFISGSMGCGVGVISYSNAIGVMGLTRVASRSIIYMASVLMMICGFFPKIAATMVTLPIPITGGISAIGLSLVVAIGLGNLQYVKLTSSRNMTILGLSMLIGVMTPEFIKANPDAIKTGNLALDQAITMFLSMGYFVGATVGLILDNTAPGTDSERGIISFNACKTKDGKLDHRGGDMTSYDLPYVTNLLGRLPFAKYIPIFPQYKRTEYEDVKQSEMEDGLPNHVTKTDVTICEEDDH